LKKTSARVLEVKESFFIDKNPSSKLALT